MDQAATTATLRRFWGLLHFPAYLLVVLSGLSFGAPTGRALEAGDRAPEFQMAGTDGRTYTLSKLLEENGGVVLAFFPKAFTPG